MTYITYYPIVVHIFSFLPRTNIEITSEISLYIFVQPQLYYLFFYYLFIFSPVNFIKFE